MTQLEHKKLVLAVLADAKLRITDPQHWCTEVFARDASGHERDPADPNVRQWCALGALIASCHFYYVGDGEMITIHTDALDHLDRAVGDQHVSIEELNDSFGHDAVMRTYDQAIETAKALLAEPLGGGVGVGQPLSWLQGVN